jgi:hypothetical protein
VTETNVSSSPVDGYDRRNKLVLTLCSKKRFPTIWKHTLHASSNSRILEP